MNLNLKNRFAFLDSLLFKCSNVFFESKNLCLVKKKKNTKPNYLLNGNGLRRFSLALAIGIV